MHSLLRYRLTTAGDYSLLSCTIIRDLHGTGQRRSSRSADQDSGMRWPSLCNRPLRSAGSPRLCLPQLAARACHHSLQILGDNPRAQKPPLWPLQKYSRMIHMCTRYLAHTQSGRNGHSIHPNEAHIFLKRGSQRSPHHGRYKMG